MTKTTTNRGAAIKGALSSRVDADGVLVISIDVMPRCADGGIDLAALGALLEPIVKGMR